VTVNVVDDTIDPEISMRFIPEPPVVMIGSILNIHLDVSDNVAVDSVLIIISLDGRIVKTANQPDFTWIVPGSAEGKALSIQAQVQDLAGNTSISQTQFHIETTFGFAGIRSSFDRLNF